MVLQNVIFPFEFARGASELYCRCGEGAVLADGKIAFTKGAKCSFDTVRAAFSVGKWKKYTTLEQILLTVKTDGIFTVTVYNRKCDGETTVDEKVTEIKFYDEINIELPVSRDGVYYFALKAEADGFFLGATYSTLEKPVKQVKLCTVICTYKRENFVKSNIEQIRRDLTENKSSPCCGNLKLIVVDNGGTLDEESGDITVLKNKNAGGAGGFTRGLIEVMKLREQDGFTHVMLCDDDIRFESEIFNLTYAFLSYQRLEYADAFLGGGMYRTDNLTLQSERADFWNLDEGRVVPIGHNLDMAEPKNLAINETEETVNHFGWWYCVMPATVPQKDNLPMPVFIKRDDIEYGLRNGKHFITLNGVFVWHEPFEAKRPAFLEYYYNRNRCIMESVYKKDFTAEALKKSALRETLRGILTFRYNEVFAAQRGIKDFLVGPEFLKKNDPTCLNGDLMKYNYAAEEHPFDEDYEEDYNASSNVSKFKKLLMAITANGWILPSKKCVTVRAARPSWKAFFRAKNAINVYPSGKSFITKRSCKQALKCLKGYKRLAEKIDARFSEAKKGYEDEFHKLTSLEFWNSYLGLTEPMFAEVPERKFTDENNSRGLQKAMMELKLFCHKIIRGAFFAASAFLPIKKNGVLFISTGRKGLTCNPKYIIYELKKTYGDKFDITYVTEYPETCDEARDMGIRVRKMNTLGFAFACLRVKTLVYTDSVPSYLPKRKKQVYINLWHAAMNYKHIGYDYLLDRSAPAIKKFKMRNPQPDYMISGSRFFTEDTAKSFRFDEGVFLPCGLPRNSIFFDKDATEKANEKVRKTYGLSDENIVIYAPTFRNGMMADTYGLDFCGVINAFEERFGGKWVIFYRGHGFVEGKVTLAGNVIDATNYFDMQELMAAAGALISDYSSAMWDMIFTGKPVFVYATDILSYAESERNFAYPMDKWRFPIARNNHELIKNVKTFDAEKFAEDMKLHLEEAGSYEDGKGAERVAALINEITDAKASK